MAHKDKNRQRKPCGYWLDWHTVERELLAYNRQRGKVGICPKVAELLQAGRGDLLFAMRKHGGIYVVGQRAGLAVTSLPRPKGYWTIATLKGEILAFIEQHNLPKGVMPGETTLRRKKRADLSGAIRVLGGTRRMSQRLGLRLTSAYRAARHPATSPENFEA